MPTLEMIRTADRLRGEDRFRKTPLLHPATLSAAAPAGADVRLKLEMFQRTGSFKARGATAKVMALTEKERAAGIVAASAGNHAQGVALAAASVGARARIVMPEDAPLTKQAATRRYGAEVILRGGSYDEAFAAAGELVRSEGGTLVHAFDDPWVMAGQGTIALEILEDLPDVGSIVCAVGGGGLIAGVATAIRALRPQVRIFGVQAEGAPAAARSFAAGRRVDPGAPTTIADGIKVRHVGERCFDVIRRLVDDIVTLSDADICRAMLALDEHAHISAEPAGAAPVAALLSGALRLPPGPAVAIVSGGNVDTFEKTRCIRRALAAETRYLRLGVRLVDRRGRKPREMARIFGMLADQDVNVLDIGYRREATDLPIGLVEIELLVETRGLEHSHAVAAELRRGGFEVTSDAEAPRIAARGPAAERFLAPREESTARQRRVRAAAGAARVRSIA